MTDHVADILADARLHAMAVATRTDLPTLDAAQAAEQDARDRLRQLGQSGIAPSAGATEGTMAVGGCWQVVAVDPDTLRESGGPFTTYGEALQHFFRRPADGAAVRLGPQLNGQFAVAVRSTPAAFDAWMAAHGTDVREAGDSDNPAPYRLSRELGRMVQCRWGSAPPKFRVGRVAVGAAALMAEADAFRGDHLGQGKIGWLAWAAGGAWAAAPEQTRRLTFKTHRLDHGVEVLGEGEVLPVYVARGAMTLTLAHLPMAEPMPAWLVTALGGTWTKP